jgi:hypothetical protein
MSFGTATPLSVLGITVYNVPVNLVLSKPATTSRENILLQVL